MRLRWLALALLGSIGWAQGPVLNAVRATPAAIAEGEDVAFEVDAFHPTGAPMRYAWDFGNGTRQAADPAARRTATSYRDDGAFDVTVRVEDASGRVTTGTVRVTVTNVAPTVRGIDRDGGGTAGNEATFRARASDPGTDRLSYHWDFGDGTMLGPSDRLQVVRHAFAEPGSYGITLTVDDGDGGSTTLRDTIVVGAGFRYRVSGAVTAEGEGASPYLTGLPVIRAGGATRFADTLPRAAMGEAGEDATAACLVGFGSQVPALGLASEADTIVRFTGILTNGLEAGTYPVAVVRNELPNRATTPLEREWSAPNTFFAGVAKLEPSGELSIADEFHGAGGSVTVERWEDGRVELTFAADLEEALGPLDVIDTPEGLRYPPARTARVEGSFAHEAKRSMFAAEGSANPIGGANYGDWYLCAPRAPLTVEEVVPGPENLALVADGGRDVPLIDFVEPEILVRFSRPVDVGSAVEHAVLEWRNADGNFVEVPILVIGDGDDALRLIPLTDLMDGVVYRARVIGGADGVRGRAGEVLAEDATWLFETLLDLGEARYGVTLATTQVARDAPLVAGKPTETRVYLNWRERPHVHPDWQTRTATFDVAVRGGPEGTKRVRVKRPDLYGPTDHKFALDSVNFHGWEPGVEPSFTLTARATQVGQVGPERGFEGTWRPQGFGATPALRFDYHFLRVGSWREGIPADARRLGHRIAHLGAAFTEQTFPVPSVTARYRGDVRIDEPDVPIVTVMGEEFYLHSLATVRRRDEVLVEDYAERSGATDADVVIAFLPKDVLRLSGFAYTALGTRPRVIAIQVDPSFAAALDYFPSTVAHEVGHTLGLPHASDCPRGAVAACVEGGNSDAIEGTRIASGGASGWNKSRWSGNAETQRTPGTVLSMMHPENLPDVGAFITNEDYLRLQRAIRALTARPDDAWGALLAAAARGGGLLRVASQPTLGVQVDGAIDHAGGRAALWSALPSARPATAAASATAGAAADAADAATVDAAGGAAGVRAAGAVLEARSTDGALLARVAIAPEDPDPHHAPDAPATLRPFTAFLATERTIATLAVVQSGETLTEWRASAHAPVLTLPPGPLAVNDEARLAWDATDADGDTLRFHVDYAPDGRDWRPLAIGLRDTSLTWPLDALTAGAAPTLRITASDGLRATSAHVALALGSAAPRVTATAPAEGEVAAPSTAVTVWTTDALGEIEGDALTLQREDAPAGEPTEIAGRVTRLPGGAGVRFVPHAPLASDARYRASFGLNVNGADGAAFPAPMAWSFQTGAAAPERTFQERRLTGRAAEATDREAAGAMAAPNALPDACAGLPRAAFAPLVPANATSAQAIETDGLCRLEVTSEGSLEEVRSLVERALLGNRLFLTQNRSEGERIRIGARGSAFTAEAVIEAGPPTRLTWTLQPNE